MRKKEREKKTQDLQKLITAADTNMESRRAERKATKKKLQEQRHKQRGSDIGVSQFSCVIKYTYELAYIAEYNVYVVLKVIGNIWNLYSDVMY